MPKARDLLYIQFNSEEQKAISYGIEFHEFISCNLRKLENILILAGEYGGDGFDFTTRCEYSTKADIPQFALEDVYQYGDFCWLDFMNVDTLKTLTPVEVSELLYFAKLHVPIKLPFFDKLNNQFAYFAHDDGWYNAIYYRNISDYRDTLNGVIQLKISALKSLEVNGLRDDLIDILIEKSKNGIVLDFDRIIVDDEDNSIEVPLFEIGKLSNMDDMYNNYKELVKKSQRGETLYYSDSNWTLEDWDYRR